MTCQWNKQSSLSYVTPPENSQLILSTTSQTWGSIFIAWKRGYSIHILWVKQTPIFPNWSSKFGGFHSHRATLSSGWLISGKIWTLNGWFGGTSPMTLETSLNPLTNPPNGWWLGVPRHDSGNLHLRVCLKIGSHQPIHWTNHHVHSSSLWNQPFFGPQSSTVSVDTRCLRFPVSRGSGVRRRYGPWLAGTSWTKSPRSCGWSGTWKNVVPRGGSL